MKPEQIIFTMPDKGNAEFSLNAEEITILAAAMGNTSYDLDESSTPKEKLMNKLKVLFFIMRHIQTFNALSARLTKTALAMETEKDL